MGLPPPATPARPNRQSFERFGEGGPTSRDRKGAETRMYNVHVAMKRRVGKVALFLLLGAILNVAVAWGFALLRDVANRTDRRADRAFVWRVGDHWSAYRYSTTGVLFFVSLRNWNGPSDEQIERPPDLIIPRWSGFQAASEQFRAHA